MPWPSWSWRGASSSLVTTDFIYTYVLTTTGYDNVGNPLEIGWIASYLLIAVCLVLPEEGAKDIRHTRQSLVGLALPYVAVLLLASLAIEGVISGRHTAVLIAGLIGVVALVLVRQFLTLGANLALFRGERQRLEAQLLYTASHDTLTN